MAINSRKTILLTGASGVFGLALLQKLSRDYRVICLVRKSSPGPQYECVVGDITQPGLGLDPVSFGKLAGCVDWVIHSAAVTRLDGNAEKIRAVNCAGTENVLDMVRVLGVPLYHISTAFAVDCHYHAGVRGETPYERAKRDTEKRVLDSGVQVAIFRPSIVMGDSDTGAINNFQGFHITLGLVLSGVLTVTPCPEDAYVDFISRDIAAAAIVRALDNELCEGAYDLTSGPAAMKMSALLDTLGEVAQSLGMPYTRPKSMDAEVFDRLIKPAFWHAVPPPLQGLLDRSLVMSRYVSLKEPLNSSLPQLLPELQFDAAMSRQHMINSLHYLSAHLNVFKRALRSSAPKIRAENTAASAAGESRRWVGEAT